MNAKGNNGTVTWGTAGAHQNCGAMDASKVHGGLPLVSLACPVCGLVHEFEDQGLRAASANGCGAVHFFTIDELSEAVLPRRKA